MTHLKTFTRSTRRAVILALGLILSGCGILGLDAEMGCTDLSALNHDFLAEEDDGSCLYSSVVFYSAVDAGGEIAMRLDGRPIGSITAYYPSGPGNCSAPGTVGFQLQDGMTHDWDGVVGELISTGTVRASASAECLVVRVF